MRILPAVDIRGGDCVNLVQGDYNQETVFSSDPVQQAVQWRDDGADLIHIVDLDGAKSGRCCIEGELRDMTQEGVSFQVGGGIRDLSTVEKLAALGAKRIILGTAAHNDPDFLREALTQFKERIAVAVDAKGGKVALKAWLDVTETDAVEFAGRLQAQHVARIIYTDILSDGMMKGPNVEATRALAEAIDISVTASGGMSSLADIEAVRALEPYGVDEVIIGRALYLKVFTLGEAIAAAGAQ